MKETTKQKIQNFLSSFTNGAIIVDLGGTLAHRGDRAKGDYMKKFHEDRIDETVRELVNLMYDSGTAVIILTDQRIKSRNIVTKWLKDHKVSHHLLFMKPDDDTRDTKIWKHGMFLEFIQPVINIKYVLEDREDTVEMWREMHVRCFQTASGQDREYYGNKQNK